jgi:UDP-glucose 4-epimerase
MSRRVLVTGGSGFIGSALCNRMVADEGHEIMSLDNGQRRVPGGCGGSDVREGREVSSWVHSSEADVVFHLAAINGTSNFYDRPAEVLDVQIRGTLNVIESCARYGVKTLVLFSSSEVYQTPPVIPTPESVPLSIPDITNPRYSYAVGKIAAEAMAWHSSIERVVIIRPHQVFGPNAGYDHVIPQFIMRSARTPDGGTFDIHGATTRSFIYIDDFVDAMMTIWKNVEAREGKVREIFHVGTEEQVSMVQLAGYISDLMGRKNAGKGKDQYAYRFKTHPAPEGGTAFRCPSIAKLRGLGWEPRVSLVDGLKRTIEAYMSKREEWPE